MAPKRKVKRGTLNYALEKCDYLQLKTITATRQDLDDKESMEVMSAVGKYRDLFRINISPLQGAVTLGHYNICKELIVKEGVVLRSGSTYPHPLCLALQKQHYEIAHLLIQYGADVNLPSGDYFPLALALDNQNCNVSIVKRIIEAGFPVDGVIHRSSKRTALHTAVGTKNYPVAKYLLQVASADPNVKDAKGMTPLLLAVQNDSPQMVKVLAENGASLDCECPQYFTPMFYAIVMDNYFMVELLISLGSNVNAINGRKKCPLTPLHFAASVCKFKIVQLLIVKGADVNKVMAKTGETPLHCAARGETQDNQQSKIALDCIVELLIKHKADVKMRHALNLTPLQVAIRAKNLSVAKLLVINGSDVNDYLEEDNRQGYTTFHVATRSMDKELIQVCFDHGADWNVTDEDGLYPLHLALMSSMLEVISRETLTKVGNDRLEIFKMFWRHGFPFDKSLKLSWLEVDNNCPPYPKKIITLVQKQNMLFGGLKRLDASAVQRAIECGAEARCCSTFFPYPLHFLACKGNDQIMKLYLKAGFTVNYLDDKGQSALYVAAMEGNTSCCQLLLEFGACYNHTNPKCPKTPLEIARSKGHTEVVQMLTVVDTFFKNIKKGRLLELSQHQEMILGILNCCNRRGLTLLQLALERGKKRSASLLMKIKMKLEIVHQ